MTRSRSQPCHRRPARQAARPGGRSVVARRVPASSSVSRGTLAVLQAGEPRMICSVGEPQRITEPLPLGSGQNRQCHSEVDFVFGPSAVGFVEELDLWCKVRDAVGGDGSDARDGPSDALVSAGYPVACAELVEHYLDPPGLRWSRPAPDVMHAHWQLFPWLPGLQRARRVGRVPLPARQCALHGELVWPQQKDVDVSVLADRSSDCQFDRVPARDPPLGLTPFEDLRYLGRVRWFPRAPWRIRPRHAFDYAERACREGLH
jgi:hypothetical protein